jgi:23S rRNA (adenine2503-C2)-methyltransferase
MFRSKSLSLAEISEIVKDLPPPISRKYCLNFAYATGSEIDAVRLRELFDPEKFMVKITPIHNNKACRANGIETIGGYESFKPYLKPEAELIAAGFDVLIFVPSFDEEDGCVTCGNAILGGSELKASESAICIEGIE